MNGLRGRAGAGIIGLGREGRATLRLGICRSARFGPDLLDERDEGGDLLWSAAQVQVLYGREHWRRLVSLDRVVSGVTQAFSQEVFIREDAAPVGQCYVVTREPVKVRADGLLGVGEMARRTAVGDNQSSPLLDELLLGCQGFGDVLGYARCDRGLGALRPARPQADSEMTLTLVSSTATACPSPMAAWCFRGSIDKACPFI